ncbi:DUF1850 domain-containing protein [Oceanobacillus alkalisoli]|uniref:DUF1850 domain-containing protein n=1 Tax=Oceanobacillus alkalisoli TaxID=2925113 RepID=UPI001EE40862|nr:DUF1850 domain-containing protein [Oceanobacillus alkalisoli]MCG5102272.1 DUF1850 domain-containing protein [Oceanobacillus alkalisoli]
MSNKKKIWIGSAFFIVLLFLLFLRLPVILIAGGSSAYYLKENEFTLGWIHSIEKEEWFERYKREKQKIILVETYFKTFGAGTPYEAEETTTENGFIHMEMDIAHEELNITVSENVNLTIYAENREIPLHHDFDDHERVVIKTRSLSIWEYIRGEFL